MTPAAWFARQRRWLLAETAQIRRRQMLVTIDPAIVSQLRVAAKRARRPVSELIEEGVRRLLGGHSPAMPNPALSVAYPMRSEHPDLFGG